MGNSNPNAGHTMESSIAPHRPDVHTIVNHEYMYLYNENNRFDIFDEVQITWYFYDMVSETIDNEYNTNIHQEFTHTIKRLKSIPMSTKSHLH